MASDLTNLDGIDPRIRDFMTGIAAALSDDVAVIIERANPTPAPTSAVWSYTVPFRLVDATTGVTIPYNGTVGITVGDTSSAGTAAVGAATSTCLMGRGTFVISGDAAAWLDTETATGTVTYTNLRGGTDTDAFVVTFTAP